MLRVAGLVAALTPETVSYDVSRIRHGRCPKEDRPAAR
jgi:hypothetical protein